MSSLNETNQTGTTPTDYEQARRSVQQRRKLLGDLVAYVLINAFLIGVWAATGAGSFWPGWVLGGWGVLLALDAWNVMYRRPVTDADIEAELRRRSPSR